MIDMQNCEVLSLEVAESPAELMRLMSVCKSMAKFGDKFVLAVVREGEQTPVRGDVSHDPVYVSDDWDQYLSHFKQITKADSKSRAKPGWDESKVVRDDIGRFAEKGAQKEAAKDKARAAVLLSKVTRPAERKKLEENLKGFGMSDDDLSSAVEAADAMAPVKSKAEGGEKSSSEGDKGEAKPAAPQANAGVEEASNWKPEWQEKPDPASFIAARDKMAELKPDVKPFLSNVKPEDLANHKLFLSADGKVGAAVSPEGDIQNVFNSGGPKGAGAEAMIAAVAAGGKTLDCYDGFLPSNYANFGFSETNRMKFNREYAPEGWDYDKFQEPDVVFMARTSSPSEEEMRSNAGRDRKDYDVPEPSSEYTEDWDGAKRRSLEVAGSGKGVNAAAAGQGQGAGADGAGAESGNAAGRDVLGKGFATEGEPDASGNVNLKEGMKIPRDKLPQILSKDMPEFEEWLGDRGVSVTQKEVDPAKLTPIQAQINRKKVDGMAAAQAAGKMDVTEKPVTVSNDDFLVDGHHRAVVAAYAGQKMTGRVVDMKGKELVDAMSSFPKTFTEGMTDNRHEYGEYQQFATESAKKFKAADPNGKDTWHRYAQNPGDEKNPGFLPDRVAKHEEIIGSILDGVTPVPEGEKPVAYIMGGGPASGKSSVIKSGFVKLPENIAKIDSDHIKSMLPDYDEMVNSGNKEHVGKAAWFNHEESSYLSKQVVAKSVGGRMNTLLDGTGNNSYDSLKKKIDNMRAGGHSVVGQYVTVDTEEAVKRSNERAAKTGRVVPEEVIRWTHEGVSKVLPRAAAEGLFDEWQLWDTGTGGDPIMVGEGKGKEGRIADRDAWHRFLKKGGESIYSQYKDLFANASDAGA